jgi:uncharacterized membrane protein YdbT with pleckstrin-like domain
MAYVDKILLPDEHIVYAATLHWVIYLRGLVMTAAAGLIAFFSNVLLRLAFGEQLGGQFAKPVALIAAVVVLSGAALLLGAYIRQTSTEIVVTNKRLIAKYGFISRTTFEILINRITGANFDQTVVGRLMGFGTILVHGAGGEISPIDEVSDPQLFYRALVSVLEKYQPQRLA